MYMYLVKYSYLYCIFSHIFRALYSNRLTELKTEWFDDTPKLENL